jgi:SEC-C motif-containing protein
MICPCGSGKSFDACCAPYLAGEMLAPTAEVLMRSRYSAYTLGNEAYLRQTWDERTLPKEALVHEDATQWLGLEVKRHVQEGDNASVEFVARYKIGGRAHRLHEVSRFVKYDGKWFYVDGRFPKK